MNEQESSQQSCVGMKYYSLSNLLPTSHVLVLNRELGTLLQLTADAAGPRLIAEQQFTYSELRVLVPLMSIYPDYCPDEVLLANFNSEQVTEQIIEQCRHRLDMQTSWDAEMRPLRNVLSRTRLKLQAFGINILPIQETGYMLMRLRRKDNVSE